MIGAPGIQLLPAGSTAVPGLEDIGLQESRLTNCVGSIMVNPWRRITYGGQRKRARLSLSCPFRPLPPSPRLHSADTCETPMPMTPVVAYVGSFIPACSATMYSAYQSGQFGSALPMSFSWLPWAADARRSALARSLAEPNEVVAGSMRPARRVVTSCSSQPLRSGSLKVAKEP